MAEAAGEPEMGDQSICPARGSEGDIAAAVLRSHAISDGHDLTFDDNSSGVENEAPPPQGNGTASSINNDKLPALTPSPMQSSDAMAATTPTAEPRVTRTCAAPGCGTYYTKSCYTADEHCSKHSGKRVSRMREMIPQQSGQPRSFDHRQGVNLLAAPVNGSRRRAPRLRRMGMSQKPPQKPP